LAKIIIIAGAAIYVTGVVLIFVLEAAPGPVTPALAAVRAIGWPVYAATAGRWPPTTRGIPFEGDE
jgi:hypothetical protein